MQQNTSPSPTPIIIPRALPKWLHHHTSFPTRISAPALNTQSKTTERTMFASPPADNMHVKHASQIPKPTLQLSTCIAQVQRDAHCALAVMDKTTGKLLNYCQLLHHPEYHADWTKSLVNEFGHLANGVGGCIKGTNTIHFFCKMDIPK